MDIKRSGTQPSEKGSGEYFTGVVRIDAKFAGSAPRVSAAPPSPSSREPARPGTLIRSVRR